MVWLREFFKHVADPTGALVRERQHTALPDFLRMFEHGLRGETKDSYLRSAEANIGLRFSKLVFNTYGRSALAEAFSTVEEMVRGTNLRAKKPDDVLKKQSELVKLPSKG
jgi:hypothetical protein